MPFTIALFLTFNLSYSIACLYAHSPFLMPEFKVRTSLWWDFPHSETVMQTSAYNPSWSAHERLKLSAVGISPTRSPYYAVGFFLLRALLNFPLHCLDIPTPRSKFADTVDEILHSPGNNAVSLPNHSHAKSNILWLKTSTPRRHDRFRIDQR